MTSRQSPASNHQHRLTYRDAGVDIDAGDALVSSIRPLAAGTGRPGVMGGIGGFGALFDLRQAGFSDPVLVSTTDGVGTKLRIAIDAGIHDTVGIDLVAMCVNDLVVQGAEPLFFLDYFATGALDLEVARRIIAGITQGCLEAGCALVGGETAEMPGMYHNRDYDLAGFAVGAAERSSLLPQNVQPGDAIIGLASNGLHSNGFSLVRSVIQNTGLTWVSQAPFADEQTLGEVLLAPTKIYVPTMLALHRAGLVNAAAHITGGGLPGNLPRVLPNNCMAVINKPWPVPPIFEWLAGVGCVGAEEMLRVFNCGIGMALVVSDPDAAIDFLGKCGQSAVKIGDVRACSEGPQVVIETVPPPLMAGEAA